MAEFVARLPLPIPAAEVFDWHARPGAFERLTPPWERIRVVERTGRIENGARLVLELAMGPLRRRWVAVHEGYEEHRQFRDRQERGPFSSWVHTHRFLDEGTGSILEDDVRYELPLGTLGAAVGGAFVTRKLEHLFAFRHARTRADLERHARFATQPRLDVLLGGASGLVSSALSAFLTTGGHAVRRLVRTPSRGPGSVFYDPAGDAIDADALAGADAVVHLAGADIAAGRWTAARRKDILESRVRSTNLLARAIARQPRKPKVLVCASAVGFYGDRENEVLTERSGAGDGFLPDVCRAWEAATLPAEDAGIRVVHLRIGTVLAARGGALPRLLPPFRLGLGGRIGNGRQIMSWIALDDLVGVIHHALFDESLAGPVNATAPEPVTNAEFSRTLGRLLRRPAVLPVPALAVRSLFGAMGEALLLGSTRAVPARLERSPFRFQYPNLADALRAELGP